MDELNKNNQQAVGGMANAVWTNYSPTYTAGAGQATGTNPVAELQSMQQENAAQQKLAAQAAAQLQAQQNTAAAGQMTNGVLGSRKAELSADIAADPYAGMSDQERAINQMYDAYRQGQLGQLEAAYQQQLSDYQAAADKIPGMYQTQANDLASQYERQRRNFNEQAAANGLNTGTASQAQLAQNSAYQRAYSGLRTAQADAQTEAERQMLQLENSYKTQVAAAISNNDFERARALLDEYNNAYNRDLAKAETLAGYGDFSGYAQVYGQEAANQMEQLWIAQNPYLAYSTGKINQSELNKILAAYGSSSSSSSGRRRGSGGGGGGDGAGDGNDIDEIYRRSLYGDDASYIAGEMAYERHNAYAEGEKAAKAAGLKPGTAEYQRYADMYSESALAGNARYQAFSDKNDERASQSAAAAQANYEKQKVEKDRQKRTDKSSKLTDSGNQGQAVRAW